MAAFQLMVAGVDVSDWVRSRDQEWQPFDADHWEPILSAVVPGAEGAEWLGDKVGPREMVVPLAISGASPANMRQRVQTLNRALDVGPRTVTYRPAGSTGTVTWRLLRGRLEPDFRQARDERGWLVATLRLWVSPYGAGTAVGVASISGWLPSATPALVVSVPSVGGDVEPLLHLETVEQPTLGGQWRLVAWAPSPWPGLLDVPTVGWFGGTWWDRPARIFALARQMDDLRLQAVGVDGRTTDGCVASGWFTDSAGTDTLFGWQLVDLGVLGPPPGRAGGYMARIRPSTATGMLDAVAADWETGWRPGNQVIVVPEGNWSLSLEQRRIEVARDRFHGYERGYLPASALDELGNRHGVPLWQYGAGANAGCVVRSWGGRAAPASAAPLAYRSAGVGVAVPSPIRAGCVEAVFARPTGGGYTPAATNAPRLVVGFGSTVAIQSTSTPAVDNFAPPYWWVQGAELELTNPAVLRIIYKDAWWTAGRLQVAYTAALPSGFEFARVALRLWQLPKFLGGPLDPAPLVAEAVWSDPGFAGQGARRAWRVAAPVASTVDGGLPGGAFAAMVATCGAGTSWWEIDGFRAEAGYVGEQFLASVRALVPQSPSYSPAGTVRITVSGPSQAAAVGGLGGAPDVRFDAQLRGRLPRGPVGAGRIVVAVHEPRPMPDSQINVQIQLVPRYRYLVE